MDTRMIITAGKPGQTMKVWRRLSQVEASIAWLTAHGWQTFQVEVA